MIPGSWREHVEAYNPEWITFLDAVAHDAAHAAIQDGDQAPHEVLADQAGGTAAVLMSGVDYIHAIAICEAAEREAGIFNGLTPDEEIEVFKIRQSFQDDPALLEAFEKHSDLLPPETRKLVLLTVASARKLPPLFPKTRSRLKINARKALPDLVDAIQARLAPLFEKAKRLSEQFRNAQPWELPELHAEHARLTEELAQIERRIQVEFLLAETKDGLVQWHPAARAIRSHLAGDDHETDDA